MKVIVSTISSTFIVTILGRKFMIADPTFPAFMRKAMSNAGAVDDATPQNPPAASSAKPARAPAPLKADPPHPPSPPTVRSGGGGHGGGGKAGGGEHAGKVSKPFVLGIALVALLLNQLFWVYHDRKKEEYNNTPAGLAEIKSEQMKLQRKLIEAQTDQAVATGVTAAPNAQLPGSVSPEAIDMADGAARVIPANAKITLRGPVTVTLVNSAGRIKSFSGDFHLHVENSENWAWTSGYDSKAPPMSVNDFLWNLGRLPYPSRVTLTVKQGTVELNT